MSAGTIRRKRDAAMRQEGSSFRTREIRQRHLPTKHCHGGSAPGNRRNPRILERLVVEAPCLVRRLRFPGEEPLTSASKKTATTTSRLLRLDTGHSILAARAAPLCLRGPRQLHLVVLRLALRTATPRAPSRCRFGSAAPCRSGRVCERATACLARTPPRRLGLPGTRGRAEP